MSIEVNKMSILNVILVVFLIFTIAFVFDLWWCYEGCDNMMDVGNATWSCNGWFGDCTIYYDVFGCGCVK